MTSPLRWLDQRRIGCTGTTPPDSSHDAARSLVLQLWESKQDDGRLLRQMWQRLVACATSGQGHSSARRTEPTCPWPVYTGRGALESADRSAVCTSSGNAARAASRRPLGRKNTPPPRGETVQKKIADLQHQEDQVQEKLEGQGPTGAAGLETKPKELMDMADTKLTRPMSDMATVSALQQGLCRTHLADAEGPEADPLPPAETQGNQACIKADSDTVGGGGP